MKKTYYDFLNFLSNKIQLYLFDHGYFDDYLDDLDSLDSDFWSDYDE